jgi:hypothetical protein
MSRAMGARATLIGAFETTYGTAPADNYLTLPVFNAGLSSEQPLIASELLGQGRDATDPFRDVITADGDVVVPVDLRNFGYWLKLLFGAPTTTGTTPKSHAFASGSWTLPSMTIEKGHPEVPSFSVFPGVKANTLAMQFSRSGEARATIGLIAQGEVPDTETIDDTPVAALALEKFNQFQGSITSGGNPLADAVSCDFTYSNNLDRIETIRADGKIDGLDPGLATLSGQLVVRFASTTLLDAAIAGTPIDIALAYTISASKKLTLAMPRVFLPKPRITLPGPAGIQATFDFQAAKSGATPMLTATLVNDVTSYA